MLKHGCVGKGSGGLFPPLPMPFRVDSIAKGDVGLDLTFLSVTVVGEVPLHCQCRLIASVASLPVPPSH